MNEQANLGQYIQGGPKRKATAKFKKIRIKLYENLPMRLDYS